jgi:hypothetical protein
MLTIVNRRRQPGVARGGRWVTILAARVALGVSAALLATTGATQEDAPTTETLPQQQLLFGVSPAAQTERLLRPIPRTLSEELLGFYAAVGVGGQHHSNVRRTPDNEISDTAYVIQPELSYQNDFGGRHRGTVTYSASVVRHSDLDSEDTTNQSLNGAINFDVTSKFDLRVYGQYNDASEERGASGSRTFIDEEPDEIETKTFGGEVVIGRTTQKIQFVLGASKSEWRYQNNNQEFRDRDYDRVRGILFYNVAPKTHLFLEAKQTDIDYPQQFRNLDSEEDAYYAGVRWLASGTVEALVKVGRLEKDMADPDLEDFDGTTYLGKLVWRPKPYSRFELYASRTTEETAQQEFDVLGPGFFVSELIGLNWTHDLSTKWQLYAYFNHTDDDHPNEREDTIKDYGVGLAYRVNDWLTVSAQHGEVDRDSNEPEVEYKDQITSIFLRGDLNVGAGGR